MSNAKKKKTLKQRVDAIEIRLAKHELYLSIDGELIRRLTEKINKKKRKLYLSIDGELIRRLTEKINKKKRNIGSGVKFKTGSRKS